MTETALPPVELPSNTDSNQLSTAPLLPLKNLLPDWNRVAEELYESRQSGKARGLVTGLSTLDREIAGALMPGRHVLHGVPGVGKTAIALQIAATCGCPCLYLTAEMAPLELLRRITSRVTKTFLGRFKTGEIPPEEAQRLVREAIEQTRHLAILDGTAAYPSPSRLFEAAEATRQLDPDSKHLLLVIDSFHSWTEGNPEFSGEYERLAWHLNQVKEVAAQLACPILMIAERNRAAMKEGGLSAGAGHRGLEYGAESMMDLSWSGKDSQPDLQGNMPVTLTLAKNRHGAVGKKISLLFNGATQTYTEDF